MRWDKPMRRFVYPVMLASALALPAQAQEALPNGSWNVLSDVNSADLAVLGWTLTGTTALQAGAETGLLVTFWKAEDGSMVRCIFSLVSRTGAQAFETCSLAQAVNEDAE